MSHYENSLLVLVLSLCAPVHAMALDCAPPADPIDLLNQARLSPENVIVGHGTFSAGTSVQPDQVGLLSAAYQFDGVVFEDGKTRAVDPGTLIKSTSCDHELWCYHGPIQFVQGHAYLVIFDRNPSHDQMGVHAGLCSSSVVLRSDTANLDDLAMCLSDGACTQADLGAPE